MSIIDDYLKSLSGPDMMVIAHFYEIVREQVPDAIEELSYGMPAFKYKGKGLVAVMANKDFLSLYPFCSVDSLGLEFSSFERTRGSIHFSPDNPISDDLFKEILAARLKIIEGKINHTASR